MSSNLRARTAPITDLAAASPQDGGKEGADPVPHRGAAPSNIWAYIDDSGAARNFRQVRAVERYLVVDREVGAPKRAVTGYSRRRQTATTTKK